MTFDLFHVITNYIVSQWECPPDFKATPTTTGPVAMVSTFGTYKRNAKGAIVPLTTPTEPIEDSIQDQWLKYLNEKEELSSRPLLTPTYTNDDDDDDDDPPPAKRGHPYGSWTTITVR